MNQFLLVSILFAVAACATPGLEATRSEALQTSNAVQTSEAVQTSSAVQTSESVQTTESGGDNMLVHNSQAEEFGGIEDLESPTASEIPAEMIPGRPVPEPAIVCERVVPTGSVLPVKVCRHRSEIERKQEADQEIFDDIKRNTALGNSRL